MKRVVYEQQVRKALEWYDKAHIVLTDDEKKISSAPGIGKKPAQRLVLELKDKIAKDFGGDGDGLTASAFGASVPAVPQSNKLTEARTALMALGFTKAEAEGLMRKIDCTKLSVEDIIREALKQLNN